MQNVDAKPVEAGSWVVPAALIALAVTAFRVLMLAFDRTDLFVDEAQYWLWGQDLAFGYYSKPPLIGWVIRASTEIGGADSPFWVRLPAPLFHVVTSMVLGAVAAPRFGARVAIWTVATFVTLPIVVVGSLMISTDTIMAPFLAIGLWAWMRGLDRGGSVPLAILAGAAVGVGFLAKYAAIYYLLCAALAAAVSWRGRPGWGPSIAGLLAFLVVISPNILWNLQNGLTTVQHTLDNADWVRDPGERADLNFAGLAEFFGSQFFVFGPVLFAGLLWLAGTARRRDPDSRLLLFFSVPILLVVCIQALLSQAYANWAAATYLAGTVVVVPWLLDRSRGWRIGSYAYSLLLVIALPIATVIGTGWRAGPNGPLLLERYLGREDMSRAIRDAAAGQAVRVIVADDRDVLADLFFNAGDGKARVFARPVAGRAPNHYVRSYSLPDTINERVLFVTRKREARNLTCAAQRLGEIAPQDGAYARRPQRLYLTDAACLRP